MNVCEDQNRDFVIESLSQLSSPVLGMLFAIAIEYIQACRKHPEWPDDEIHQAGIVCEESGELMRAALQYKYEEGEYFGIYKEAIQTGAMALRLLVEKKFSESKTSESNDFMCQECEDLIDEDEWEMFSGFCEDCYTEGLI